MREIEQLGCIVSAGNVEGLDDDELIKLSRWTRNPMLPSDCKEWAKRIAVPLLRELATRFQRTAAPLRLIPTRVDRLERVVKHLLDGVEGSEESPSVNQEDRDYLDNVIAF